MNHHRANSPSTTLATSKRWRIVLLALALIVIGGVALAIALLLGVSNPPHASHLKIISSADLEQLFGTNYYLAADLRSESLPITFEVEARVKDSDSWGLLLATGATLSMFYIRNDGYFRTQSTDWQSLNYIHSGFNKLELNISSDNWQADFPSDYHVTFRINDESAWRGAIPPDFGFAGVIAPIGGNVEWKSIKVYTG